MVCSPAGKFFELDEWEHAVLESGGRAPFCRTPLDASGNVTGADVEARELDAAAKAAKAPAFKDLSASQRWGAVSMANSLAV